MADKTRKIVEKKTRYGADTKTGVRTKIGTALKFDNGEQALLLNPNGKGKKYAKELKDGCRYTNDMKTKKANGLTKTQRAYRNGYLASRKDSANAYNANKK